MKDKAVKGIFTNEMTGTLENVIFDRYVISYQQAEYIRNKYTDGTDEEKLIRHLKESDMMIGQQMNLQDFI